MPPVGPIIFGSLLDVCSLRDSHEVVDGDAFLFGPCVRFMNKHQYASRRGTHATHPIRLSQHTRALTPRSPTNS